MRRDVGTVLDIVLACKDIEKFVSGMSREEFAQSDLTQAAVVHKITVMGEATKRLSEEFREEHSNVPWKSIAGMRDQLIHACDETDLDKVWIVASEQVPVLRQRLEPLIPPKDES